MELIMDYLRTFDEFEKAYSELKEKCQKELNRACDSLTLVKFAMPVPDKNGRAISVEIKKHWYLVLTENETMMFSWSQW